MASKPLLVSSAALAKHVGVSRQYVERLTKDGVLKRAASGRIDQDRGRLDFINYLRAKKSDSTNAADEYRRLKSKKLRIEIAKLDHSLIALDEALAYVDDMNATFRRGLDTLPMRISRTDPALRASINNATDALLNELSALAAKRSAELATTGTVNNLGDDDGIVSDAEGDGDEISSAPH